MQWDEQRVRSAGPRASSPLQRCTLCRQSVCLAYNLPDRQHLTLVPDRETSRHHCMVSSACVLVHLQAPACMSCGSAACTATTTPTSWWTWWRASSRCCPPGYACTASRCATACFGLPAIEKLLDHMKKPRRCCPRSACLRHPQVWDCGKG